MLLLPTPPSYGGGYDPAGAEAEGGALPPAPPRHVAYATRDKVVGLLKLPLDGNPNKGMGLVAHPGEVSAMAVSWDGAHLLTAGGGDLAPHLSLLDGGAGGTHHQEMRDYFYYAQLRAQGEDTTEPRRITGRVPISELGNLMRALGYYPSEREIDELQHEARVAQQAAGGEHPDSVDFDSFVKLYVNHRPVFGVGKDAIATVFGELPREALSRALASHGETLSTEDLAQCLRALTGVDELDTLLGPKQQIDAPTFAEKILGFEDYV